MSVFDDEDDDETSGSPLVTNSPVLTSSDEKGVAPPAVKGADSSTAAAPDSGEESAYLTAPASSSPQEEQAPADPVYSVAPPPPLPQSTPLTPLPDHSQDENVWAQQKAKENPAAYKPSGWRRAGAGIAAALTAAGSRNPEAGLKVGEGVLDAPKDRMEAEWAAQEAPIQARQQADQQQDQRIRDNNAATLQQNTENDRQYRNQVYEQGATARAQNFAEQAQARRDAIVGFVPDNPANPYDGGTGKTADGRTVKGVQPPDKWMQVYAKSTTGQQAMQQMTLKQRQTAADQIGLKGTDRTDFLANGKIPARAPNTNIRIPSAQSQEYQDAKAAMIRENGGKPLSSAQLLSLSRKSGASGGGDPEDQVGAIVGKYTSAKQTEASKYTHNKDGSYTNSISGQTLTPEQFTTVMDNFRARANADPVLRKAGYEIDQHGNVVKMGQPAAPQNWPANAPPAQQPFRVPSGKTITMGAPVTVNGRNGTVTGINPKTGRAIIKWAGGQ